MNQKIYRYSLGYMGQGAAYNFMSTYFIVFMTDCIGMSSTLSGTIMSLALLVEVAAGMVVGNLSDSCTSPMGKRRPFILAAGITLPVIIFFLFRQIEGTENGMFTYYLSLSILFRLSFALFEIPNNAFGAEVARGYDERTRLRTVSRVFGIVGNTAAYIMPLFALELFATQSLGWRAASIIIASICGITWIATFILTKPYVNSSSQAAKKKSVLSQIGKNYLQLAKLKPMRILIVYKAAFACALALFNIGMIYYMRCCIGLSNHYISYIYFITVTIFLATTPLINKMALKMGKSGQQKWNLLAGGIVGMIVYLFCGSSLFGAVLYVAAFSVTQNSFWQLSPSIFYDIAEVDEFVNGQRREGDIVSMVSVLGTLITSLMVQLFGFFLDMAGYDAANTVQDPGVISFLRISYVLIPTLCFLIGAYALKTFPINKKTFNSLTAAVALKKEGKDYTEYEDDIKKILG